MPDKDPLEDLYDKVEELLRFAKEKAGQPIDPAKIPPDAKERLKKIHEDLAKFNTATNRLMQLTGTTEEEVKQRIEGNHEGLTDDTKYLLNKGDQLLDEAHELKRSSAPSADVPLTESKSKPSEPLSPRRRKGKFKRFGGDANWKPL